ncbi:protein G12-like [Andrena cerasifolii]|uniref:protein G12-like n=1 Tax=Andrena cerasifolii TaxID=2819439 RepID=UPI004037EDE5
MMKFTAVVLAVLAMSSPLNAWNVPRAGTGALADELQKFVDIVPLDKMVSVLLEYVSEDTEVQTIIAYLKSPEFKNLVIDVEALPEVYDLINYIQNAGVDAFYLVNKANAFLGIPALKKPGAQVYGITGGVRGLIDDIKALLPKDKIKALYQKELANSKVFADLIAKLKSPTTQRIVDAVRANPNYAAVLQKAKDAGINVEAVKEFLERVLGLKFPLLY